MRSIPFGKPILGKPEHEAVAAVLDSGMLVHGEQIKRFEADLASFTGAPYAVGVASCTAALHLAYFHYRIGAGAEVIVPAMTHTATAHAVELSGAKPIFVDATLPSGNIDVDAVRAAVTPATKAISVVHYLGAPADMKALVEIARQHDLKLIEDCARAIGAYIDDVHVGLWGDLGCFSFYPVKHMTTAEGGAAITRHESLSAGFHLERAFGVDRHVGERAIPGVYDVVALGFNYRMSEIEAALGVQQLKRLPGFLETRAKHHARMWAGLKDIDEVQVLEGTTPNARSSHYCHSVLLDDRLAGKRPEIIAAMKAQGVGTSVYYPHPVPGMRYYRDKYALSEDQFPNAKRIANQTIALPVGPHLDEEDVDYVVAALKQAIIQEKSS
ncbi:MAG: DegT/DnrJ/EryC1/StrS family aminotransferase [Polyangiaceae bacterium]